MKKRLPLVFGMVIIVLLYATTAVAYIDNLVNMSAEWVRTGNRNAATDSTDIVNYNPAGLSELSQGFHLNFHGIIQQGGRQFNTSDVIGDNKYKEGGSENSFSSAYGALNIEKWTLFGGIDIPTGGTERKYTNGSVVTRFTGRTILASPLVDSGYNIFTPAINSTLSGAPYNFLKIGYDGSSDKHIYTGISNEYYEEEFKYHISTLGFAYKINKAVSFALGLRFVNADSVTRVGLSLSGLSDDALVLNSFAIGLFPTEISLESQKKWIGWGTGGIFGLNLNLTEKINLAMHLQTPVKLIERVVIAKDELNLFSSEEKQRNDLPGMAGMGIGYDFSDKVSAEFDFSYWFQSEADWEKYNGIEIAEMAGDAWKTGVAFSFRLNNKILTSIGGSYTKYNWEDLSGYNNGKTGLSEDLYTDNYFIGTGFSYEVVKNIKLNFGVSHTIYKKESFSISSHNSSLGVSAENESSKVAFGVDILIW